MKFKRNILSLAVYGAVLTLIGCGVTTQDAGTGDSGAGQVSGVAVDGYIALAVVYVDTNTNNKLDVWEARALTDARGYFTYSPELRILGRNPATRYHDGLNKESLIFKKSI